MDIFEKIDVGKHVDDSRKATTALNLLRLRIKNKDWSMRTDDGEDYGYTFKGTDFDDLTIIISPRETNKLGSYGYKNLSLFYESGIDIIEYAKSNKFEATFRHEFQHYLDDKDGLFRDEEYQKGESSNIKNYVNQNIELSAFFKQQAEHLLVILRNYADGVEDIKPIETDFTKYMRQGTHFSSIKKYDGLASFSHQNKKNRLVYIRNIATLHKAVVLLQEAHGKKYFPTIKQKVLGFLSSMIVWKAMD